MCTCCIHAEQYVTRLAPWRQQAASTVKLAVSSATSRFAVYHALWLVHAWCWSRCDSKNLIIDVDMMREAECGSEYEIRYHRRTFELNWVAVARWASEARWKRVCSSLVPRLFWRECKWHIVAVTGMSTKTSWTCLCGVFWWPCLRTKDLPVLPRKKISVEENSGQMDCGERSRDEHVYQVQRAW